MGVSAHFLLENMATKTLMIKICELIKPIIETMGFELWGCELQKNQGSTLLRIYIDSDDGVKLSDCQKVSNQISGILEVENLISGNYNLEVSSPGLDRFLFTEDQYRKFINSEVSIRLSIPFNGKRTFRGKIIEVMMGNVNLITEEGSVTIPINQIEKAKIVPQF